MTAEQMVKELNNKGYNATVKDGLIDVDFGTHSVRFEPNDCTVMEMISFLQQREKNLAEIESQFSDKDWVTSHLSIGLQRKSQDEIIKKDCFLPMIEAYLYIDRDDYTAPYNSGMLKVSGMSEQEAWQAAFDNLMAHTKIYKMDDLIPVQLDESSFQYVVTTDKQSKGAAAILNMEALRNLAREMETDTLLLLPSSIHEFIVTPYRESDVSPSQMVRSINQSEVPQEEQLSDYAYKLDINTGAVEVL